MHDQPTQRAVLALVLDSHPKPLDLAALARQMGEQDAVERAVDALASVGLLTREGDAVSPSAAAVHFDRLELP